MVLNASIGNAEFHSVPDGEQAEGIVERVLAWNHTDWASTLFISDEVLNEDEDDDWYPDAELHVSVNTEAGYGALHWHSETEGNVPFNTCNPEGGPELRLIFDGGSPSFFDHSAILPLEDIRSALLEFIRTGKCPEGVEWQRADSIL